MDNDLNYMKEAYKQALKAMAKDEVPIGAVIVKDGKIISRAYNLRETKQEATKHAEIIAIEKACRKLGSWHLDGCELYVTLEPCVMCSGAIINARIKRVIYGASESRWLALSGLIEGNTENKFNHQVLMTSGVYKEACENIIKQFFKNKREKSKVSK